jgi:hypothetical protein
MVQSIVVDGITYTPSSGSSVKIVILQRGFVFVGRMSQDGPNCKLSNASCVRIWGTTRGLGEIAKGGPTSKTVLDKCPDVRFHELTIVATIDCVEEKWNSKL